MMTNKVLTPVLLLSIAAIAATAYAAPPKPKISKQQAMAAAVKKIPGKAASAVYELEDGHWQYAVIVNTARHQMYEVAVNPTTGKIITTEKTSVASEVAEWAADNKADVKGKH